MRQKDALVELPAGLAPSGEFLPTRTCQTRPVDCRRRGAPNLLVLGSVAWNPLAATRELATCQSFQPPAQVPQGGTERANYVIYLRQRPQYGQDK